jgi:hypothetical protein
VLDLLRELVSLVSRVALLPLLTLTLNIDTRRVVRIDGSSCFASQSGNLRRFDDNCCFLVYNGNCLTQGGHLDLAHVEDVVKDNENVCVVSDVLPHNKPGSMHHAILVKCSQTASYAALIRILSV